MNKERTLKALNEIIEDHHLRMRKIQTIIKGKKINNNSLKLSKTCVFTAWLRDEEKHLEDILGSLFYGNLDKLHLEWHKEYLKIYNIFFKNEERGLFSKLLNNSEVNDRDLDKAKIYYFDLEKTSTELLRALILSQNRVEALSLTKFH